MTVLGRVIKGEVKLSQPLQVPDGTEVRVEVTVGGGLDTPPEFWSGETLADIIKRQGVQPPTTIDDLQGDWPADESIDEFLDQVRRGRQ